MGSVVMSPSCSLIVWIRELTSSTRSCSVISIVILPSGSPAQGPDLEVVADCHLRHRIPLCPRALPDRPEAETAETAAMSGT
jgi:hypothetical protein